eukprot:3200840-Prymnesium_polylepis.1
MPVCGGCFGAGGGAGGGGGDGGGNGGGGFGQGDGGDGGGDGGGGGELTAGPCMDRRSGVRDEMSPVSVTVAIATHEPE